MPKILSEKRVVEYSTEFKVRVVALTNQLIDEDLTQYLSGLCHEWASERYPNVMLLSSG